MGSCKTGISGEDWAKVEFALAQPFGQVEFHTDGGVELSFLVRKTKGSLKFWIMMYVNGRFKGVWSNHDCDEPEAHWIPLRTRSLFTGKQRQTAEKLFGKREAKKRFDKSYSYRDPVFRSGRAVRRHLTTLGVQLRITKLVPRVQLEELA